VKDSGLNVLIVDDSESDVALIEAELRRAGHALQSRRVYDEATMQNALDAARWDVVLCDSSMPNFGARRALELLGHRGLNVPLIAVSGNGDASAADHAISLGARAYVRKDDLARLAFVIERELAAARAEAAPRAAAKATHLRILLIDDDTKLIRAYQRILSALGSVVEATSSAREALESVSSKAFDAIVTDVHMPEMTGLEFLVAVRERDIDIPVILMTGEPSLDSAMRAVEFGAFRYLVKPVDVPYLDSLIRRAVQLRQLARWKRQALEVDGVADARPGDRAGLEARFGSALEKLWIAFQPIVSWRARRVFGYEALLRSSEPTLRSPPDILDAAERLGRLHELGRTIRRAVAAAASSAPPQTDLFVNLHSADLNDEELYDAAAPLAPFAERVVLEITERASLDDVPGVQKRIDQLRQRGYRIAVDDLGAGYAGLNSFTLLDPKIVKLDMTLVRDVHCTPRKQRVVEAIARLCGDLGMLVVAEGVENAAERDMLVDLGCDLLQGYWFAKPEAGFPTPRF
jgi:EAL domain-containing protein (putative c-di-GMP-specific phosphodiesterase class I)/DNA-binding NarL/FixJ family response regulator